jgi:hypothetical protein
LVGRRTSSLSRDPVVALTQAIASSSECCSGTSYIPSRASQFAGKPSTRHRTIPPRNTDTCDRPASWSCCAAMDDRRSVLQTTTTGRFSRTRSGKCAGNSTSGMFVACLICPRGPVNSSGSRTSRISGASSRPSCVASAAGSIHDGAVGARPMTAPSARGETSGTVTS